MTLYQNDRDDTIIKVDDGTSDGQKVIAVGNRAGVDAVVSSITASSQPLPTGAATATKQDTGNTSLGSIDTKLSSQATATKQDTGNTSLASIDTKLSSQATAANQATEITRLTSIDGKMNSLGQKVAASSMPVILASDQTLPLPSGAATAANQTTANTSLASIDTKVATAANQVTANASLASIDAGLPNALGQNTKANSTSVVLASDYQVPVINQIVNFPVYEDMNASTGGVARGTNLTTTYTNIYSYTGAGLFYGFRVTYQTLNVMQIRILIDGVDVLMGSTGLSLADAAAAALYNFSATIMELGVELDGNSFTFQPPAALKFSSSVVVKSSVISGAAKQFLAGFAVRST